MRGDVDYFSNVASAGQPLEYLVYFLAQFSGLFSQLNEAAQLKIKHAVSSTDVGRTVGWFAKDNLLAHGVDVGNWIETDSPVFTPKQFDSLLALSDSEEWQERFCSIVSTYYGASTSFDQADSRFQIAIPKYIDLFSKSALIELATKIEANSQCHDRNRSRHNYVVIKNRIEELFGKDFDYEPYSWFSRKLGLKD